MNRTQDILKLLKLKNSKATQEAIEIFTTTTELNKEEILVEAIKLFQENFVETILEKEDFDLHYKNDLPLYFACKTNNENIISLLMKKGADFSANNYAPLVALISTSNVFAIEVLCSFIDNKQAFETTQFLLTNNFDKQFKDFSIYSSFTISQLQEKSAKFILESSIPNSTKKQKIEL